MIQDFITMNMGKASYEQIDGGKRFYAEVKGLRGVWAIGKTLEECRHNLMTTIEGWLIIRHELLQYPYVRKQQKTRYRPL